MEKRKSFLQKQIFKKIYMTQWHQNEPDVKVREYEQNESCFSVNSIIEFTKKLDKMIYVRIIIVFYLNKIVIQKLS